VFTSPRGRADADCHRNRDSRDRALVVTLYARVEKQLLMTLAGATFRPEAPVKSKILEQLLDRFRVEEGRLFRSAPSAFDRGVRGFGGDGRELLHVIRSVALHRDSVLGGCRAGK